LRDTVRKIDVKVGLNPLSIDYCIDGKPASKEEYLRAVVDSVAAAGISLLFWEEDKP
jgi:hypothetical protein